MYKLLFLILFATCVTASQPPQPTNQLPPPSWGGKGEFKTYDIYYSGMHYLVILELSGYNSSPDIPMIINLTKDSMQCKFLEKQILFNESIME